MINKYYQRELNHLRELAVEFSKLHPALAPMLAGQTPDPDVERLLEGTAFLSGLINEKLDDEFPEIVHGLMQLLFPHYLRPIPSTTIMRFSPKRGLMEPLPVPKHTQVASIEVDGTSCLFSTSYAVDLHPLKLTDAKLERPAGGQNSLRLSFSLANLTLDRWEVDKLRLHLSGAFANACNLYLFLFDQVSRVSVISTKTGDQRYLPRDCIKRVGFSEHDSLLPYPTQSFPGYRVLQEYFILPQKFLFFDLDLSTWTGRGSGADFDVVFELKTSDLDPPEVRKENFSLFCTPALNLFSHSADPILLDHRQPEYRITPSSEHGGNYQVYSVDQVTGFAQGSVKQRNYVPFELFNPQVEARPVYTVTHRKSPILDRTDLYLSVAYPADGQQPAMETLSLNIHCSNGDLPEKLQLGDIQRPTETSPGLADFDNIIPPTAQVHPPLGKEILWRLLSHLYLNYLHLADADNLRAMIKLYIFTETRDRATVLANTKRVDAINDMSVKSSDRLVRGILMRGQSIDVSMDRSGFAGSGDMFLFGSVLDYFIAGYAAVNCYTRLKVEDTLKKELYQWPERIGDRPLL